MKFLPLTFNYTSRINLDKYSAFVKFGGTRSLRRIHSDSITKGLPLKNLVVPRSFLQYESNLTNLFIQKNLTYVFNSKFVAACVYSFHNSNRVIHPIPKQWQTLRIEDGFSLFVRQSHFLWKLIQYKKALEGVLAIVKHIFICIFPSNSVNIEEQKGDLRIWTNLRDTNYFLSGLKHGFTFANWLTQRQEFSHSRVIFLCENNPQTKVAQSSNIIYSPITNIVLPKSERPSFIIKLILILSSGIPLLFTGKPEFLGMADEIALALKIDLSVTSRLPNYVFFTESDGIVRPLWTYSAEKKGIRVIYLFFSNSDSPIVESSEHTNFELYSRANWNEYWVVDEFQRNILLGRTKPTKPRIEIVGNPWRTDSQFNYPKVQGTTIAIFDYEAHKGFYGFNTINDIGYEDSKKDVAFLRDLLDVASKFDIAVLHKPKRSIAKSKRTLEYEQILKEIELKTNYFRIPAEVSPVQLISKVDFVFSLPLTSTALIAKTLGKVSLFYDPIGQLNPKDPSLRDIELIQRVDSLRRWFEKTFS